MSIKNKPLSSRFEETAEQIELAKQGNSRAFTKLYETYHGYVASIVRSRIDNPQVAEEIVQDTFNKAFLAIDSFETNSAFGNWLKVIAINTIIDFVRTQQSERNTYHTNIGAELQEHHTQSRSADDKLLQRESMLLLKHAINNLHWKDRRMYNLRFVQNLKYDEIAKELNVAIGTVKSHIFKVRENIKKQMTDY